MKFLRKWLTNKEDRLLDELKKKDDHQEAICFLYNSGA
jgi:hypothetical protein